MSLMTLVEAWNEVLRDPVVPALVGLCALLPLRMAVARRQAARYRRAHAPTFRNPRPL
jgi:hypothetical protein